jgi:AcrR family transcriptional regulator
MPMDAPLADPLAQQRRIARGLAVREQMVDAAVRACAERGYSGCSVVELSAAAGLSKNHLFHHFGSKERLILAALERVMAVWRNDVAGAAQIFPQAERQLDHATQQLAVLQERGWAGLQFLAALSMARPGLPADLAAAANAALDEVGGFFRRLFKESRKSGSSYGLDAKPKLAATLFVSTLLGSAAADGNAPELLALLRGLLFGSNIAL